MSTVDGIDVLEADVPVDELLEVMSAAGAVDGVDTTGLLDVLDQVPQLLRRIVGEAGEGRFLPEPSHQVGLT